MFDALGIGDQRRTKNASVFDLAGDIIHLFDNGKSCASPRKISRQFNRSEGKAGFGTRETPGAVVRTEWRTGDIWLRRAITLPDPLPSRLVLRVHHDEDVEIYVNGVRAASAPGYIADYEELPISAPGRAALRPGQNILAIHCHQTRGGQYVDAGLVTIEEPAKP